jgi:hypothetical protein
MVVLEYAMRDWRDLTASTLRFDDAASQFSIHPALGEGKGGSDAMSWLQKHIATTWAAHGRGVNIERLYRTIRSFLKQRKHSSDINQR